MLQRNAGDNQAEFRGGLAEIADTGPDLVHGNVEIINGLEQVSQQAGHNGLQARVAALHVKAGGLVGEFADFVFGDQVCGHGTSSSWLFTGLLVVFTD